MTDTAIKGRKFDITVTIGGVDVSQLVKAAGRVDYGRQSAATGYAAPSAIFDMFTREGFPLYAGTWPAIDVGMAVVIHVTWDGTTQHRRFTGTVQAIDHGHFERRITAAGTSAGALGLWCGSTSVYAPRGAETDIARVGWLSTTSGAGLTIEGAAGRWVRAVPMNNPLQPLLEQVLRIADDCDGRLLEDRLGVVHYRSRNFTPPAPLLLPYGFVESHTLTWTSDLSDVRNSVDVYFGEPAKDTGQQPHVHRDVPASISALGERKDVLPTDLQWADGADGKAVQYLAQKAQRWAVNDATIVMSLTDGPTADAVLDYQEGWPVQLTHLPPGAPVTSYDGTIIGFTEILHESDYRIVLHLVPTTSAASEPAQDPIYPDGVLTGYDSQGLIAGTGPDVGKSWRWVTFTTPGAHTLTNTHTDPVWAQVLAVAGGGGGGYAVANASAAGGGGGAGAFWTGYQLVGRGAQPVTVGAGGTAGGQGADTYALGQTLPGGGVGGYKDGGGPAITADGGDGGSGGGSGYGRADSVVYGVPGTGVTGYGWDGSRGGGGGAGGPGSGPAGGAGVSSSIDGTTRTYARGGDGAPGAVTSGAANSGTGGSGYYMGVADAGSGGSGRLTLKYRVA